MWSKRIVMWVTELGKRVLCQTCQTGVYRVFIILAVSSCHELLPLASRIRSFIHKGCLIPLMSRTNPSSHTNSICLRSHKTPGVDQIPSKLIQAGGGKLYETVHKLIVLRKISLFFPVIRQAVCIRE